MKENKQLVSVIIPAYNAGDYIIECIESIIRQTYANIEILVINDGSTDDTEKKVKKIQRDDNRIRLYSKENGGVSSARNLGIEKSKGSYLFFVDSDDILDPCCIEYYHWLTNDGTLDMAITPFPNKFVGKLQEHNFETNNERTEIISGKEAMIRMLYYKIVISSWGKMVRKKIITDNNIRFNEKLKYGEGFSFSIECFQAADHVGVGYRKVYNYRLDNPSSAMTKYRRELVDDSLKAQDYISLTIKNKTNKILSALEYSRWHTECDCLNTIIGSGANESELTRRLIKNIKKTSIKNIFKPIPRIDKIKSIFFTASPILTSKIINAMRKRTFTEVRSEKE